jgi:hypothetical protein
VTRPLELARDLAIDQIAIDRMAICLRLCAAQEGLVERSMSVPHSPTIRNAAMHAGIWPISQPGKSCCNRVLREHRSAQSRSNATTQFSRKVIIVIVRQTNEEMRQ